MNATFHRSISNDLAALEGLMNEATSFLEAEQVEPAAVYRINLALEEIVSNVIKYGYDDPGRHEIRLLLEITGEEVRAVIEDDGHEFNPLLQPVKNNIGPLEERQIGGQTSGARASNHRDTQNGKGPKPAEYLVAYQ